MLPQTNCQITRVSRIEGTTTGGYSEDYDRPATDPDADTTEGVALWNGQQDAYLIEKRQRVVSAEGRDLVKARTLVIEPTIEVNEGDTLTWVRLKSGLADSGRVLVIERPELPGRQSLARLTLEDVPG